MNDTAYDFTGLRALFINCTLKRSPEPQQHPGPGRREPHIMERRGVTRRCGPCHRPRHRHRGMARHARAQLETDRSWPVIFEKVLAADILWSLRGRSGSATTAR